MELDKELPICSIIQKFIENDEDNQKLVTNFYVKDGNFSEQDFKNFTNVFRSLEYTETIKKECLEAISEDITMSIMGISNIIEYCTYNNYNKNKTQWQKKRITFQENVEDLFDINMNISIQTNQNSTEIENWENTKKKFIMKKDFVYTKDNVTYIASLYKTSDDLFYSLKKSKILKSNQMYGFKIIIEKQSNTNSKSKQLQTDNDIIQYIVHGMQAIMVSSMLLTKPQQKNILNDYNDLVKNDISIKRYGNKPSGIPLLTPKPITLERINMLDPSTYGVVSILSSYTVTEKADGERLLLYVNEKGRAYLINNTYKVEDTGLTVSKTGYNSLIDGEYILCNNRKDNVKKNLFAAFDIYYIGGKKITQLPLIHDKENGDSRYKYLMNFEKIVKEDNESINFIVKQHRYSDNILKDSEDILSNKHQFPYDVDGLIFTPAKLALYSFYTNNPVKLTSDMKWDRVFKWKPDEQNTIDFLVSFKSNIRINNEAYKICNLYVGYNASQNSDIDINTGLRLRYDHKLYKKHKESRNSYVRALFNPSVFHQTGVDRAIIKLNSRGEVRTESNELIETESIVEFRYINDQSIPVSERWKPIRVREDKTRMLRINKQLSKTANDHSVAQNIWRSIHNPVTEAMIRGKEPVFKSEASDSPNDRLLNVDDIYYSRNIPRENLLSVSMVNFHNQGIKKALYNMPIKRRSLLELCCGEGGDMSRWIDSGYDFIFGVDFVKKNIYNPKSGAYSRMIKRGEQFYYENKNKGYTTRFPNMAFAVGDCSERIKDGTAAINITNPDKDSENLLKKVLNPGKSTENHTKYIIGRGANGFNAISCMFAIHYFFESEEKLNGFFRNISENIKSDGIFFCTFMNGDLVQESITNNNGDMIEGRKFQTENDKGMPIWAIVRRYNKDHQSPYGKKIDVFIENTQKFITEYLVSTTTLIEKAQQYGLKMHKTERFKETFDNLKKDIPDSISDYTELQKSIVEFDKDDVLKKFSFLNQWMVFTKM